METLKYISLLLLFLQFSGCGTVTTEGETNTTQNEVVERDNTESDTELDTYVDVKKSIELDNFINYNNCDQVLEKEFSTGSLLSICYDYGYKSSKYVAYMLDGTLVNAVNINSRPSYHVEWEIPSEYRTTFTYTQTGYEHGHLAPDASFDYNEEDLELVYSLVNIVPQDPTVNGNFWSDVENYARDKAVQLGELNVINGMVFGQDPDYIGENRMAVAKAFWKILYNDEKEFRECYYYDNFVLGDANLDALDKHKVDCVRLII